MKRFCSAGGVEHVSRAPGDRSRVVRLGEAEAAIPREAGQRAASVMQRGTLDVKLSCPVPPNHQTPHAQDEIYVPA